MLSSLRSSDRTCHRLSILPDLVIERILYHVDHLSDAFSFAATCRDIRFLSLKAASYWKFQYQKQFGYSIEENNWVKWQRTRQESFGAPCKINPNEINHNKTNDDVSVCWYLLLCRRGILERQWKKCRWRPGGVRVQKPDDSTHLTINKTSIEDISIARLQLIGNDERFLLLADHIRGRLIVVEPESPARMVELEQPTDITENVWPVKLGSITFGRYWMAASMVDTGVICIWQLKDGSLMEQLPTPWKMPNITSLYNWLLVQPDRQDNDANDCAFFKSSRCACQLRGIDASTHAIVYHISQNNIPITVVDWPSTVDILTKKNRPRYALLPSSKADGLVELSAYISVNAVIYWAYFQANPLNYSYTQAIKITELDMVSTSLKVTVLKEGHFSVSAPLLGDIVCWPLGSGDGLNNEERVLLLDSYGDEVNERYFFIRINTANTRSKPSDTELLEVAETTQGNTDNSVVDEENILEIERQNWIGVHSLTTGELVWQRAMRGECRGRLLPSIKNKVILCTFDRGAFLLGMENGEITRVFRATGGRLALHPVHAIGSVCVIWAKDGKSVFCIDIGRQRAARRSLPGYWSTAKDSTSLILDTSTDEQHKQFAAGASFLAMVKGDSVRWILFSQP